MFGPGVRLSVDLSLLAWENHVVVTKRLTQLACGHSDPRENNLMVTEKVSAFLEDLSQR